MGRRSTKSSPTTGAALPFDTVGMTILPGRSLPEWAEPHDETLMDPGPELIADAPLAPADEVTFPAAGLAQAPSQVPQEWTATAAAPQVAAPESAWAPEPALAMAGAAVVGAHAAGLTGYPPTDQGYAPEPSKYPAAPTAGLATMPPAPAPVSGAPASPEAPGFGPVSVPAHGQGWPASATGAPAGNGGTSPQMMSATAFPTQTGPLAPAEHMGAGSVATATHVAGTDTRTASEHAGAGASGQTAQVGTAQTEAPSSGWKSPERPELTPEHVALLSWWADMIAAGQFPAPPGMTGTEASTPEKRPRRSFPVKAAATALVAVAAVGTAAVVGPKVMASSEPVVVPSTELSLPAAVGGLVAITDPAVGTELETLLGFGLRPAGVTVTNAYGTAAQGPLAMAAMATTMGAPAEAVGQIAAWAERTGATVAPSVPGTGANEGITCAAVEAIPDAQPGSFCVWTGSANRGQTYSVAMSVADAQTLTNQLRTTVIGT